MTKKEAYVLCSQGAPSIRLTKEEKIKEVLSFRMEKVRFMLLHPTEEDLLLVLYNHHNGYYSHVFLTLV